MARRRKSAWEDTDHVVATYVLRNFKENRLNPISGPYFRRGISLQTQTILKGTPRHIFKKL